MVYFDEQKVCKNKNFGFKNIDNIEKINIIENSNYFRYYFNEINAYGNKNVNYKINNNKMKCEFIYRNENIILPKLNYEPINNIIPNKINISEITNFYIKLSEKARIFPIFLDYIYKKEDNIDDDDKSLYDKTLEDFLILKNIYQNIKKEDEENVYYYNYFSEEINEFINSYLYLKSMVEFKSKKEIKMLKNKKRNKQNEINKKNNIQKKK